MMDTLEGNKLIAEFDGWKEREPFVNSDSESFPWWEKFVNGKVIRTYHHDILSANGKFEWGSYHTSWDWLMPVWVKFRELKAPEGLEGVMANYVAKLAQSLAYDEMETFHRKLSSAIQWYNQNKKQ